MDHLAPEALLRFVDGRATREEVRTVVRHLLRGCADCGSALCRLHKSTRPCDPRDYDEVFDRCPSWTTLQQKK